MGSRDGDEVKMKTPTLLLVVFSSIYALNGQADKQVDPFEGFNRKTHRFNDFADRNLVKPIARAYRKVLPDRVRYSIGNVYGNLADVGDAVNNLLQGKPGADSRNC